MAQSLTRSILPAVFQQPVEGVNLQPGTLGDQVDDRPTLLVFLRHFG